MQKLSRPCQHVNTVSRLYYSPFYWKSICLSKQLHLTCRWHHFWSQRPEYSLTICFPCTSADICLESGMHPVVCEISWHELNYCASLSILHTTFKSNHQFHHRIHNATSLNCFEFEVGSGSSPCIRHQLNKHGITTVIFTTEFDFKKWIQLRVVRLWQAGRQLDGQILR